MKVNKQLFININKYIVIIAMVVYWVGILSPVDYLQPGLVFVFGAAFFCLLNIRFFAANLKTAAALWSFPLFMTIITYPIPLTNRPDNFMPFYVLTAVLSLIPMVIFLFGSTEEKEPRRDRLPIITVRMFVQIVSFMGFLGVTAFAYINRSKAYVNYWAFFHVTSSAIFPFVIGRVLCSWMCPNATWQDAVCKNLTYKKPFGVPAGIDAQSRSCSMSISGKADKNAPFLPATLLIFWFIAFMLETIFDLSLVTWWSAIVFMMGLFVTSMLFPWRKVCTHFCWLSGYRTLASQASIWRLRFNKSQCRDCKTCAAEEACPYYIDIRNQEFEMPATCCLCFSCMEACPYDGVITFKMHPEDKKRLKDSLKTAKQAG